MTNKERIAVAKILKDKWMADWQYYFTDNTTHDEFTKMLRKEFEVNGTMYKAILVGSSMPGNGVYAVFRDVTKSLDSPSWDLYFYRDRSVKVFYEHNYAEDLRLEEPNHPALERDDYYHTHKKELIYD